MIINSLRSTDNLFGDLGKNFMLSCCCKNSLSIGIDAGWSPTGRITYTYCFPNISTNSATRASNYIKRKHNKL